MTVRLDRWLANLALGSRSEVGRLIRSGAVTVNGNCLRDPAATCDERNDCLTVQGRPVDGRLTRHVLLYKPDGLLTSARDRKQPTVMDLLPPVYASIGCMPVGRLDKDTTGLLLLTTDGELNHRLLAPNRHVDKTYRAEVEGEIGTDAVERVRSGLDLGDFVAAPAELVILSAGAVSTVRLTICEGKFHQVKRMMEAVGHPVLRLHRERFGPLTLPEELTPGAWREATEEEINALYRSAQMERA